MSRRNKGESGTRSATAAVLNANYSPLPDACRGFLEMVCEEVLRHPAWKPDVVVGLAWCDFSVLFELP